MLPPADTTIAAPPVPPTPWLPTGPEISAVVLLVLPLAMVPPEGSVIPEAPIEVASIRPRLATVS